MRSDTSRELVDRLVDGKLCRFLRVWRSGVIKPEEKLVAIFIDGLWQTVA